MSTLFTINGAADDAETTVALRSTSGNLYLEVEDPKLQECAAIVLTPIKAKELGDALLAWANNESGFGVMKEDK